MARKSRKPITETSTPTQKTPVYLTALYARLSIEDNGIDSESIENQIYIIQQFIKQNPELHIVDQFIDNGQTGTNFDRPSFTDMMDNVRKGKINCIIVKDLSRFGRNYIETGNYLEKIFPYLNIRFISLMDHFDSLHAAKNDTLIVSLKSILHDTYAKDISQKVSTAIDVKKKSGKYMGKIPPYGYVRDTNDRYKLVIHPERAQIVKQIFQWRIEGFGPVTIAHRLNDMKIPTQFQIRFLEGHADGKPNALWYGSSVLDILKNPCYLGCIVERKSSNSLYKGKNHKIIPTSEWKLIENTHEPIINKEIFYQVRKLLEESLQNKNQQLKKYANRQRTENILRGLVRCGICGGRIHRNGGYFEKDGSLIHYSFSCVNKYIKAKSCSSKAIFEKDLLDCVFQVCKKQLELLIDMEALIADLSETVCHNHSFDRLNLDVRNMENKCQILHRKKNELYADYKEGLISKQEYEFAKEKYEADSYKLEQQITNLHEQQKEIQKVPIVNDDWIKHLIQFKDVTTLTREMCNAMIKEIIIYDDTISIHFAFASEYEKVIAYISHYTKSHGGNI